MARRRKGRDIHGVLLLDKPPGLSSSQAVQRVRHLLGARKAGHTGSLDPFATGMLPVCLGEASKTAAFLLEDDKTYRATACLGSATDTGDIEGAVKITRPVPDLDESRILEALSAFTGRISQVPPMYSALKHQGQPLYKLAREGHTVHREPREITIHEMKFLGWNSPLLSFDVRCSKGTYIRTLAEDIAGYLGTCGHLQALRRLAVEPFDEAAMVGMDEVEAAASAGVTLPMLLPIDAGLRAWPKVVLDSEDSERFCRGNPVPGGEEEGMVRVYGQVRGPALGQAGSILGLGEVRSGGLVHPKRVFVFEESTPTSSQSGNSLVNP